MSIPAQNLHDRHSHPAYLLEPPSLPMEATFNLSSKPPSKLEIKLEIKLAQKGLSTRKTAGLIVPCGFSDILGFPKVFYPTSAMY